MSPRRPKPARGGGGRGAPRGFSQRFGREAAGILLVLVLAVACAVAVAAVAAKGNADAAMAAKQSASYTPPTPTTPPGVAATDPTVVVIGDETVTTSSSGVSTADRWPALLDKAVTGKVAVSASAGAGYTTAGSSGLSFADQAATIPASAKVVVFFGGLNDVDALALDVSKAATTAFSAAKKAAPKAKFIVVGPVVGGAVSASDVANLRNALKVSAGIADFTWIDPISKSWVADAATKQATTLTTTDEAAISKKVATAVSKALG